MNNEQILFKEEAKNPDPQVKIACSRCKAEHEINACLREEPLPSPHVTVIEGFIICPNCGLRTHSYYLSEATRYRQVLLRKAVADYHRLKTNAAFNQIVRMKKMYANLFDKDQKRFGEIMAKVRAENEPE